MSELNNEHLQRYQRWKEYPYLDPETRNELERISGDEATIKELFSGELEFGTGGMRGIMGPGSARFNRYVVRKATQGLANYLKEKHPQKEIKVALAFDPRHQSREFAEEAALVLCANNIKALVFDDIRPTPVLSFAIRYLDCAGGIVITASHNPPEYNGYKVYGNCGAQFVPSDTEEIVEHINQVDLFQDVKLMTREEAISYNLLHTIGEEVDRSYIENVKSLCTFNGKKDIRVVFTPLHGTGHPFIPMVLNELGYENVFTVEEQLKPDPSFSSVKSPNPEEKEAFSLALDLAHRNEAEIVLATDPDCDRVGCGVKNANGEFTLLNGNQIGALLLNYLLEREYKLYGSLSGCIMIKTVVTNNLGKKIAEDYGVETEETLTGFKFIGEKIRQYQEKEDCRFLFGYEESYGYLAGTFTRDKDGIITSSLLVDMAAYYHHRGVTLLEKLEELYRRYGYHLDELSSFKLENERVVEAILKELKHHAPQKIGDVEVKEMKDYREGISYNLKTGRKNEIDLPRTRALFFQLEDESWICVRPSGTEPKMKIYYSSVGNSREETEQKLKEMEKEINQRIHPLKEA